MQKMCRSLPKVLIFSADELNREKIVLGEEHRYVLAAKLLVCLHNTG